MMLSLRFILAIGCVILVVLSPMHALTAEAPSPKYQKTWGNANQYCVMRRGVQTADGYIIAGEWADNVNEYIDVGFLQKPKMTVPLLIETDAFLKETRNCTYNQSHETGWFEDVKQTADHGYIAVGATFNKSLKMYLVKADKNLTFQWNKTFGGPGSQVANAVELTNDGGYLIAGWTDPTPSTPHHDVYIVKTYANGTSDWNKTFGGEDFAEANTINKTADGGYIIGGDWTPRGAKFPLPLLLKISKGGESMQSLPPYGGDAYNLIGSVKQTDDRGYIAAGMTQSKENNDKYGYILKYNAQGELIGHNKDAYNNNNTNNSFLSVVQTKDGGYVVGGYTTFANKSRADYLAKFDSTLKKLWCATYNFEEHSTNGLVTSIQQTNDGGYFIVGRGGGMGWAAKLDPEPGLLQQIISEMTSYANQNIPAITTTVIGGILVALSTSVLLGRRQNK